MGCILGRGKNIESVPEDNTNVVTTAKIEGIHEEYSDNLEKWEKRQKRINDRAFKKMRNDFFMRPDHFIANMLVLSTQFYKNFEQERNDISQIFRDEELSKNKLLSDYNRRILFLGAHEVVAARHTLYHPRGKKYYEMPAYKQTYVIQVNADLFPESAYESLQETSYQEMASEHYRLCVEASNRHVGYVRLKSVDLIPGVSRRDTCEDLYRSITPVRDEHDPNIDRRPPRSTKQASEPSSDSNEVIDDEENEAILNRLQGRRPSGVLPDSFKPNLKADVKKVKARVEQDKIEKPSKKKKQEYPQQKIQTVLDDPGMTNLRRMLAKIEEQDEESEGEDDAHETTNEAFEEDPDNVQKNSDDAESVESSSNNGPSKSSKPDLRTSIKKECFINRRFKAHASTDVYHLKAMDKREKNTYLSSERYQLTFEDDFPEFLEVIKQPGLTAFDVEEPFMLTHEMTKNNTVLINSEYIPALHYFEFPPCAAEWIVRERTTRLDDLTKMTYRWPKDEYIKDIARKFGCELLPMGYYNPNEINPRIKLIEWQIQFVKAEQILMRSLGHQQIRLLLLIQLLLRDHLDERESRTLKPNHLRYVLFEMCENNYRDWEEDQLAMRVKEYLKLLSNCLSERCLPHYFIKRVNLLDNMKEKSIRVVQECFQRIAENLPIYIMHTLRRLRTSKGFYPRLNLKELYNLIKHKKVNLVTLHPNLMPQVEDDPAPQFDTDPDGYGFAEDKEEETEEHKKLQEALMEERARRDREKRTSTSKKGTAAKTEQDKLVDLFVKVQTLNDFRTEKLLTLLAEHFIKMAEYSNKFEAHPQAYKYVHFATNMLQLLQDEKTMYEVTDSGPLNELRDKTRRQRNVTMQGINKMLNMTHCLTENLEIKVANTRPRSANWSLYRNSELNSSPPSTSSTSQYKTSTSVPLPTIDGHRGSRETVQLGILKTISQMESVATTEEEASGPVLVPQVNIEVEPKASTEKPKKSKKSKREEKKKKSTEEGQSSKILETRTEESEKIVKSSKRSEIKKTEEREKTEEIKIEVHKEIEKPKKIEDTKKIEEPNKIKETEEIQTASRIEKHIEEAKKTEEAQKVTGTKTSEKTSSSAGVKKNQANKSQEQIVNSKTAESSEATKTVNDAKTEIEKTATTGKSVQASTAEAARLSGDEKAKVKVVVQSWKESGARRRLTTTTIGKTEETTRTGEASPAATLDRKTSEKTEESTKHKRKEEKEKVSNNEVKKKNEESIGKSETEKEKAHKAIPVKLAEDVNQSSKTNNRKAKNNESNALIIEKNENGQKKSKTEKESVEKSDLTEEVVDRTLAIGANENGTRKDIQTDEQKQKKEEKTRKEKRLEKVEKKKPKANENEETKKTLAKDDTGEPGKQPEVKITKRKEEKQGEKNAKENPHIIENLKSEPTGNGSLKSKTSGMNREDLEEKIERKQKDEKESGIESEVENKKKEKRTKNKTDEKTTNISGGKSIENTEERERRKREKKEKKKLEKEAAIESEKKNHLGKMENNEEKIFEKSNGDETDQAKANKEEKPKKKEKKTKTKEESNKLDVKKEFKDKKNDTTKNEGKATKTNEEEEKKKNKKETKESTSAAKKSEKESKKTTVIEEQTENTERTK